MPGVRRCHFGLTSGEALGCFGISVTLICYPILSILSLNGNQFRPPARRYFRGAFGLCWLKRSDMGRKWGQHFLRSPKTVDRILSAAALEPSDVVLEIGPGEGVITLTMCERAKTVHAFEIDPQLAEALQSRELPNLKVHQGDFLKTPATVLGPDKGSPLVVVANLPYYITAPILERLSWQRLFSVKRAVLMMQEEVALRVCRPASREAGALTYIVGAHFDAHYLFKVPPGCFSPPPKVDSAVISLVPRDASEVEDESLSALYEKLVSTAFQTRRKQLGRSLRSVDPRAPEILEKAGLDPKRRPETLEVQEFWKLARKWPHCE